MPSVAAIGYGPLLHSQAWTGVHGRSGFSTAAGPSAGSCFSRLCVMSLVPQPLDLLAPTSTIRSSVQVEITCSEHKSLFWQLFFFCFKYKRSAFYGEAQVLRSGWEANMTSWVSWHFAREPQELNHSRQQQRWEAILRLCWNHEEKSTHLAITLAAADKGAKNKRWDAKSKGKEVSAVVLFLFLEEFT